jgi:hypothetical protein
MKNKVFKNPKNPPSKKEGKTEIVEMPTIEQASAQYGH